MINPTTLFATAKEQEKAVLVAVITQKQDVAKTQEYLDELGFLASTAGVKTLKSFVQRLERPDNKTFVGKGKLQEIELYIRENPVDMIIFDDDLSPSQVRNLESIFKEKEIKILDRSLLILNIFSQRAQTDQSKRQVELAQYQYLLPRLTRMWSHLSRQKGGIGMRGPGEKELETDKRIVQDRIAFLKDKLEKIEKQSVTRRKERDRLVRVALVGYTNVGKSTLMQRLAKSDVFAENKLFATVDSTVRKVVLGNVPFLLTDTVGFIRKLPTTLIESFKSTLDEIREADILLHVVDISHSLVEEQIEVVNTTLAEIKANDKPVILVFNKLDLYKPEVEEKDLQAFQAVVDEESYNQAVKEHSLEATLEKLRKHYLSKNTEKVVFISAEKKENLEELREILLEMISERHLKIYPNWVSINKFDDVEQKVE